MLKSEVSEEVARLLNKRQMMGKSYEVTSVDCVHCMEDLLYWRYCDQLHWKWKLQQCSYLPDVLMDLSLPVSCPRLFHFIGSTVVYNNVSLFDKEEAKELIGVQRTAFREALEKLESIGLIKVHKHKMDKRGDVLVSVAPAAYWNGDFMTRNHYMKKWYTGVGDTSWLG